MRETTTLPKDNLPDEEPTCEVAPRSKSLPTCGTLRNSASDGETSRCDRTEMDRFAALSDEELAELAQLDEAALSSLYRRYVDRIARYVGRRIMSRHEAEDVTAQVFLTMVRGLRKWKRNEAPFVAWIYRLATNAVISWSRRQKLRRWIGLESEPAAAVRDSAEDAEELQAALLNVPEPFQRVLVLHYIEQLPVSTVALTLGVAEGTIKSRLTRGRSMLKQILNSRQGT